MDRMYHACPSNMGYAWNFGVYALVCLFLQILTGILLAMVYTGEAGLAFISVEYMMREVGYGWLMRYIHSNGASMLFLVVYLHMFRGFYYGSYKHPREGVWLIGVLLLIMLVGITFLGYVLVWGQMSFWAATVITNTVSAIPLVGSRIVFWLWGGTFVGNATLSRFSTLHYVLPFVLLAVVMVHILLLHSVGSSGYLGMGNVCVDDKPFYPYYVVRDGLGLSVFMMVYMCLVCFYPNVLGSPDNYEVANVLVTPKHIVPEWYLMPYFSVLRGIPDKLAGVIGLAGVYGALAGVALIPSTSISKGKFWIFTCICLTLGYLGSCSMSVPYSGLMTYFTIGYFTWFFLISIFDRTKPKIIPTGRPTGRPRTP